MRRHCYIRNLLHLFCHFIFVKEKGSFIVTQTGTEKFRQWLVVKCFFFLYNKSVSEIVKLPLRLKYGNPIFKAPPLGAMYVLPEHSFKAIKEMKSKC